jgi:hypothetical protein
MNIPKSKDPIDIPTIEYQTTPSRPARASSESDEELAEMNIMSAAV